MKRYFKLLTFLFFAAILFGCSSVDIRSDYDVQIDFGSYQSFTICADDIEVTNPNHPAYDNEVNRQLIRDAITKEMEKMGYQSNGVDPALQVGFQIIISDERLMMRNCREGATYEYWMECKIDTYDYTEGTLVISVSDIDKNQVIWQGSAQGILDVPEEKTKKLIHNIVKQIFQKYPSKK